MIRPTNQGSLTAAVMTMLSASLALVAAVWSLIDETIYGAPLAAGNINEFLRIGSLAQDIVTVPLSLLMLVLGATFFVNRSPKVYITMLGLVGYLLYAYGLYAMQGQYTSLYIMYLAVFSLSIYALVYGLSSFDFKLVSQTSLSKPTRVAAAVFLTSILVVLVPVWLMLMLPTIAAHRPADTYGVFVLDLAIVFPALAMVTVMLFRKNPYGNVFGGVALIKAFTVCLSVAFGELYSPWVRGLEMNVSSFALFGALTVVSGVLFVLYLRNLKVNLTS